MYNTVLKYDICMVQREQREREREREREGVKVCEFGRSIVVVGV